MSTLRASVSAGESGPVITLSGQADITTAAELSELITGQLAEETQQLTVTWPGWISRIQRPSGCSWLPPGGCGSAAATWCCCVRNERSPGCWKSSAQTR